MAGRKPWERADTGRRRDTRPRRRVLIACEDEKSSRDYFLSFPVDQARAEIVAVGTGMNTISLVEYAIELLARFSKASSDKIANRTFALVMDDGLHPCLPGANRELGVASRQELPARGKVQGGGTLGVVFGIEKSFSFMTVAGLQCFSASKPRIWGCFEGLRSQILNGDRPKAFREMAEGW